ncbi:hypothetical protein ZIOFF_023906 [Zingiber officinale]|uniref:Uncharacterized protein n=1 Tax=Zingiber officinale TaxID=94328 RepID=A0A8J5LCQ4_ZINOF|nr:hypothetical protein ZIOFF_023906 [Zingiber officinale]
MLDKMQMRKNKLDKKLKSIKAWRKVSSIIFAATLTTFLIYSIIAAAIAAPPVATYFKLKFPYLILLFWVPYPSFLGLEVLMGVLSVTVQCMDFCANHLGFSYIGPRVIVWSIKPIQKDEEVCITYINLLEPKRIYIGAGTCELEMIKVIGDVKGRGLMLGVELVIDRKEKMLAKAETAALFEELKDLGVLLRKEGLQGNVFRIKSPMCFTKEDAAVAIRRPAIAWQRAATRRPGSGLPEARQRLPEARQALPEAMQGLPEARQRLPPPAMHKARQRRPGSAWTRPARAGKESNDAEREREI